MRDVIDSHTHSIASGHAYSTIHEMAATAAEKGIKVLGITDHAMAMPGTAHEYHFMNMKVLPRKMYGIEVLFGSEVNIIDYSGNVDMEEYLLRQMDVVVASLHIPCIKPGTKEQNTAAYIGAMKNPYVNIIGHPDDSRYAVDYHRVVLVAKEQEILIELNNSSLRPSGVRENPIPNDVELLLYCKKYRVPIILSSDAHCQEEIGDHTLAQILLESVEFPEDLVVNRSVAEYKKYINRFKG